MERSVYISSEINFKFRLENWWRKLRLKSVLKHVGLLVTLMVYTIFGGLIFRRLEYPAELSRLAHYNNSLGVGRRHLLATIINNSNFTLSHMESKLEEYENILYNATIAGLPVTRVRNPPETLAKWTILKAVFFSSTVLTTIGYGNIVPLTTSGRAFCMLFAFIGIPLTLSVIADWGRIFATAVSALMRRIPPLPRKLRNATVARRTSSYALSAICFLFVYLSAGAGVFMIWEDDWTFFDGFYFCFITMTTIGFGDLVPKKPKYMLLCTLYILVGLALTSTIIELVRRQYAQSWRQLQALSGPLADNLRKLAENAPGLDVTAFQQDLRKVLTVVTMSRKQMESKISNAERKAREKEWEEAMEAVIRDITAGAANKKSTLVQIVIYESSV